MGPQIPWQGTNMPSDRAYFGRKFIGGELEERKERNRQGPASSEKGQKERAGVGGACLLKRYLHLHRIRVLPTKRTGVATLPLPGPQGKGPGLHLPGW